MILKSTSQYLTKKIHFIIDHFSDYFDESQEALGTTSDQLIEAMHQYTDAMLRKSAYWVKDPTSVICGVKQHRGVLKINAYSVTTKS